jgi:hypothetical protein
MRIVACKSDGKSRQICRIGSIDPAEPPIPMISRLAITTSFSSAQS